MNRTLLAALAVGTILCFTNVATAQYGRGCNVGRGISYSYSTPYYSYRSYGPGTHISRYAVPQQSIRLNHGVSRSYHYRLPPTVNQRSIYGHSHFHNHGHSHFHNQGYYPYRGNVGRGGTSFSIRF